MKHVLLQRLAEEPHLAIVMGAVPLAEEPHHRPRPRGHPHQTKMNGQVGRDPVLDGSLALPA